MKEHLVQNNSSNQLNHDRQKQQQQQQNIKMFNNYVLSWLKLTNNSSPEGSAPFAARFMT